MGTMIRFGGDAQHTGYLATPPGGVGPAVLVLHAWWGLNDFFQGLCDRLAGEGFIAFAPDLYGGGDVATTIDEASHRLDAADHAQIREIVLDATRCIVRLEGVRPIGIGVIGFSMGAAWSTELAALRPNTVRAVTLFYGAWSPDNVADARAAFLGHFSPEDEWEPAEGVEALEQALKAAGCEVTFHFYPGAGHWFFEADRPDAYAPAAAHLAWERTLAFLRTQLPEEWAPLPRSTAELLARISDGWADVQAAAAGLTGDAWITPGADGWSAAQHLAHITFWEDYLLRSVLGGEPRARVMGVDEATAADIDGLNATIAARNAARPLAEIQAASASTHAQLVAALGSQPIEVWQAARDAADPDEQPVLVWIIGNTYGHYGEHVEPIRARGGGAR